MYIPFLCFMRYIYRRESILVFRFTKGNKRWFIRFLMLFFFTLHQPVDISFLFCIRFMFHKSEKTMQVQLNRYMFFFFEVNDGGSKPIPT